MANYKGYKYLTSVAGVKFANSPEDGGELRQAILSRLTNGDKKNEYTLILDRKPSIITTQRGVREDAIKVMVGRDCIGFIPRKDIAVMRNIPTVVGIISYYEPAEAYSVNLYAHEVPTGKQYKYVKTICNANSWPQPLYTRQDYTNFITAYQRDNNK